MSSPAGSVPGGEGHVSNSVSSTSSSDSSWCWMVRGSLGVTLLGPIFLFFELPPFCYVIPITSS